VSNFLSLKKGIMVAFYLDIAFFMILGTMVRVMAIKEFAVIKTGGKQYKVSVGDTIKIEKLPKSYKEGDKVTFDEVLMFDNGKETFVGAPTVSGKSVEALFQTEGTHKKVVVAKYKSKTGYFVKNGHKQPFIEVKVSAIK